MTTTASKKIDGIIQNHLHPFMKEAGFIRKGRTWNRHARGMIDVMNVQTSQWNEPTLGSFTINVGVLVPKVYALCWGKDTPTFPKEEDCIVRARIGALIDRPVAGRRKQKDVWWDMDMETDLETLGNNLRLLLREKIVPFFDQFDSLKSIKIWWEKQAPHETETPLGNIFLAIIDAQLGYKKEAKKLLEDETRRDDSLWKNQALGVSARLGI